MKQTIVLILIIWAAIGHAQSGLELVDKKPIHQLRIYEVPSENMQAFHDRFRDHAHRIMKKYDFPIVAMWESKFNDKTEFIYLLEWEDESTMEGAWDNFMADQEWKDIKALTSKEHGTFVNNIEDRTLELAEYSPQVTLTKDK
ncbi:NIPSNAP family protein [Algoriphagus sp. NG3]|uniref:NIPSNAP family protein n=1 Tax=Algoriphagus sp. NG3 TaxID=3097546 RepID=UPI002A7FA916|nr:NIPSNAP family protein [Algoriphagus sp. NG3]WPR77390.1 NIPSNAP family protein [Algoriphagus sp. NG3]